MITWILAALAFLLGTITLVLAMVFASVGLGIVRRGRGAADEAYRRGDSLASWFDPSKTSPVEGPRHDARAAIAGRRDARFGVVAVTEHASDHIYGS